MDVGSSSIRRGEVYKRKEEEPVLASLSDLYSELDKISVGASGFLASLTSHHLLTTCFTYYYSN